MLVRPGFGETLPAMLRRRYGVRERTTLAVAAGLVVLAVLAVVLLHDPFDGKVQRVHRGSPVFNVLYTPGLVEGADPRDGELDRYQARRGPLRLALTIRPLRLPPYRGDASGVLPIVVERHARTLARALPGFRVTGEGRARVGAAPGYEISYSYGPPGSPSTGRDVLLVPPEEPGVRDGVVMSLRENRAGVRRGEAARDTVRAIRAVVRSFRFGTGRDY